MSADLHKSLEECEASARALVKEMQQYKASRQINEKSVEVLDQVAKSLNNVIGEIKPLTGMRLRKFMVFQTLAWCLTTALVVGMTVLVVMVFLR